MENLQNLRLLSKLYRYRALGIDYFEDEKTPTIQNKKEIVLPDSMSELQKIVQNCSLCQLYKGRKNIVFGEGDESANIMFVGEGPGAVEDEMGRPFVGKSGQLLTKIIETTLLLKREEVYIANIVKCRPPLNRAPTKDEAQTCLPFLLKQIELVKPKIIITLGATAYKYLTGDYETSISKIRGEIISFSNALLLPTFHPSFLLRNPSAKRYVFNDMKKIKAMI
jgi:DNA polymerase